MYKFSKWEYTSWNHYHILYGDLQCRLDRLRGESNLLVKVYKIDNPSEQITNPSGRLIVRNRNRMVMVFETVECKLVNTGIDPVPMNHADWWNLAEL